jgi:hypothetical protein
LEVHVPSPFNSSVGRRDRLRALVHLVLLGVASVVAMSSFLIARWIVLERGVSAPLAGTAAFCVAWIVLSPWARQRVFGAVWVYWVRGAWFAIILWVAIWWTR